MEQLLNELSQFDLEQINFYYMNFEIIPNSFYILHMLENNQLIICTGIHLYSFQASLSYDCPDLNMHLYKINSNFNSQNLFDIFYNFCYNHYNNNTIFNNITAYCLHIDNTKSNFFVINSNWNHWNPFIVRLKFTHKYIQLVEQNDFDKFYTFINNSNDVAYVRIYYVTKQLEESN
jgi:hypothetical protein